MTPLFEQFIAESRELLEGIDTQLMALERAPDDRALMDDLFRRVHTLKGNSGLFDVPEMPELTQLLHAAEDLLDSVRSGVLVATSATVDSLLRAMDHAARQIQAMAQGRLLGDSVTLRVLTTALQQAANPDAGHAAAPEAPPAALAAATEAAPASGPAGLAAIPEALRLDLYRQRQQGAPLWWLVYTPDSDCFFKGEDPLHLVRQIPQSFWARAVTTAPWPEGTALDVYHCQLSFEVLCGSEEEELKELFRYVPDQLSYEALAASALILPQGRADGLPGLAEWLAAAEAAWARWEVVTLSEQLEAYLPSCPGDSLGAATLRWLQLVLELSPDDRASQRRLLDGLAGLAQPGLPTPASAPPSTAANTPASTSSSANASPPSPRALPSADSPLALVLEAQSLGLALMDARVPGNLQGIAATLDACCAAYGLEAPREALALALEQAQEAASATPLADWLEQQRAGLLGAAGVTQAPRVAAQSASLAPGQPLPAAPAASPAPNETRTDQAPVLPRTLRVDQERIDQLMDLIGEIVVAKNGLPYLAARAEEQYGVRELSREIKAQYAVINRITEALQDAIMQVRMLPLSFIFQRFPRLVRDLSRKLGKEVELVLEGEDTEADKNIVEALADPLIHVLRNSLDHGLETPEERRAANKPAVGRLTIRATQEADQVLIDILDDGRGIDPQMIRRKALEKGLLDEAALARLSDEEAQRLIFVAGFSTAGAISDLSGRGVGMDVVRNAVEKVNGTLTLSSTLGRGTSLRLALPLSLTVSRAMMVEANGQRFGIPLDQVAETVRIDPGVIRCFKQQRTLVLRDRLLPLVALHDLLALPQPPKVNADGQLAVLVMRFNGELLGVQVDDFHATMDIILKPLGGVLAGLPGYAGSALLGDGSVLMVLDLKELL